MRIENYSKSLFKKEEVSKFLYLTSSVKYKIRRFKSKYDYLVSEAPMKVKVMRVIDDLPFKPPFIYENKEEQLRFSRKVVQKERDRYQFFLESEFPERIETIPSLFEGFDKRLKKDIFCRDKNIMKFLFEMELRVLRVDYWKDSTQADQWDPCIEWWLESEENYQREYDKKTEVLMKEAREELLKERKELIEFLENQNEMFLAIC